MTACKSPDAAVFNTQLLGSSTNGTTWTWSTLFTTPSTFDIPNMSVLPIYINGQAYWWGVMTVNMVDANHHVTSAYVAGIRIPLTAHTANSFSYASVQIQNAAGTWVSFAAGSQMTFAPKAIGTLLGAPRIRIRNNRWEVWGSTSEGTNRSGCGCANSGGVYEDGLAFESIDPDYNIGPLETVWSLVRCMPADYNASRVYPYPLGTDLLYSAQNDDTGDLCNEPPRDTNPFLYEHVVVTQLERPEKALVLDAHNGTGFSGNGNGILEPGETIRLEPSWQNLSTTSLSLTGSATSFGGPSGATYTISDSAASYGTLAGRAIASCWATQDCYKISVSNPGTRPVLHWDTTLRETLGNGYGKTWTLHVGKSFTDVAQTGAFYSSIETLIHRGITAGCGGTQYCPGTPVTRAQMAVFIVKAKNGPTFVPPPAVGVFADVPPGSFAADWIEELYNEGITSGCGGGNFCPNANALRQEMAVFMLKAKHGSWYAPPTCHGGVYTDVACPGPYSDWIEELAAETITAQTTCLNGGSNPFCPGSATTREQMASFIVKTFQLALYASL